MRRRLLTIAILLLVGAVVNVAVAWGCGWWVDVKPSPFQIGWKEYMLHHGWRITKREAFGATRLVAWFCPRGEAQYKPLTEVVPAWRSTLADEMEEAGRHFPRMTIEDARGWPLRSLWCRWAPGTATFPKGGILLKPKKRTATAMGFSRLRALPYWPVWPGVITNTLFYATLLWLLIPGPFALRRFIRVRRGLCPKCAYPMGESAVCSECGWNLPKRVRAVT